MMCFGPSSVVSGDACTAGAFAGCSPRLTCKHCYMLIRYPTPPSIPQQNPHLSRKAVGLAINIPLLRLPCSWDSHVAHSGQWDKDKSSEGKVFFLTWNYRLFWEGWPVTFSLFLPGMEMRFLEVEQPTWCHKDKSHMLKMAEWLSPWWFFWEATLVPNFLKNNNLKITLIWWSPYILVFVFVFVLLHAAKYIINTPRSHKK